MQGKSRRRFLQDGGIALTASLSLVTLLNSSPGDGAGTALAATFDDTLPLPGQWNLIVTFTGTGQKNPSEVIYAPGGIFLNLTPGPGAGKWYATGNGKGDDRRTFFYEFTELIYTNGTLTNYVHVTQQGKLSKDGKSYTAHGVGILHDMDGTEMLRNPTTTVATRVS